MPRRQRQGALLGGDILRFLFQQGLFGGHGGLGAAVLPVPRVFPADTVGKGNEDGQQAHGGQDPAVPHTAHDGGGTGVQGVGGHGGVGQGGGAQRRG